MAPIRLLERACAASNDSLRAIIAIIVTGLTCAISISRAAPESTFPRIGVLTSHAVSAPVEAGLQQGLRDLGYVDGQNARVEWRRSAGTLTDLRALASELVRAKVDVMVTLGTPATRAAIEVTSTPIVFPRWRSCRIRFC
jgi:putative ABC transport system substrate-binding protein